MRCTGERSGRPVVLAIRSTSAFSQVWVTTSSTARAGAMSRTFEAKSGMKIASKSVMGGSRSRARSSALRRRNGSFSFFAISRASSW